MVDICIVIIIALSVFVGFIRGATREVLGFISWVGAFFSAIYLLPFMRPLLSSYIHAPFLVDLIGGVGIFLIALVILSLFAKFFSSQVKDSLLSGIDRSLGAVFGFSRGVLVISILYVTLTFFLNPVTWPEYLKESKLVSISRDVAECLIALVPEAEVPSSIKDHFSKSMNASIPNIMNDIQTLSILRPEPEGSLPQATIPAS